MMPGDVKPTWFSVLVNHERTQIKNHDMELTIIDAVTIWTSTRVRKVATSEGVQTEARDEFKRQTASSSEPPPWQAWLSLPTTS
jgi:hypothetical protein